MQKSLFGDEESVVQGNNQEVLPQPATAELIELAAALPPRVRFGTSSWNYPGWKGLVWAGDYTASHLSRHGLAAYGQYPLFRTVSIDRSFYRPMSLAQYAEHAAQVGADFRFVIKAPNLVTDALVRDESGRGMRPNPTFLNPAEAVEKFVEPALAGLGSKLGALVFQISPLPGQLLMRMPEMINRLHRLLKAIPDIRSVAPDGVVAVEVRDPQWLVPSFAQALRDAGATYCISLHPKMPSISGQLPVLRALWPGPLVCRWNLNTLHGAYGYEEARDLYLPFDHIVDPDPETRAALLRVIAGTAGAGQPVYVTLSNKAEGCAPLSIIELARALRSAAT